MTRSRRRMIMLAALAAPLAAGGARANGFHVDEQDARATGRAGAVTASTDNASAIYYNPAGIAQLDGLRLDVGASLLGPHAEFTSVSDGVTTPAETQTFVLPQVYASYRPSRLVAFGLGFNAPFGLALEWPASSPGRTSVRSAELRTFFFTGALALELSRWVPGLAVGAGVDLVPASVRIARDVPFGSDVATAELGGDALGAGVRAGIIYRPPALPALSVGLSYRSPVALEFSGNADFDALPAYRANLPPDGDVRTSLTLPQTLTLGVAVRPIPEWEIEVDGSYRGWSSYDELEIELPDGNVERSPKDWEDAFTVRVGTELTLAERWAVRLGAVWDQTPVPSSTLDFQLPDADRIDLTIGVGARLTPNLHVDVGGMYVLPQERDTAMADAFEPPVKGRFDIDAWIVGLSVGLALDVGALDQRSDPNVQASLARCGGAPGDRSGASHSTCQ